MKSTRGWRARARALDRVVRRRVERALAAEREELALGLEERRVRRRVRLGPMTTSVSSHPPLASTRAARRAVMTSAWRCVCARATGARPLAKLLASSVSKSGLPSSKPRAAHATAAASSSTLSSAATTGAWTCRCRSSSSAGEVAVQRTTTAQLAGPPAGVATLASAAARVLREAQRQVGRDARTSGPSTFSFWSTLKHCTPSRTACSTSSAPRAARAARLGTKRWQRATSTSACRRDWPRASSTPAPLARARARSRRWRRSARWARGSRAPRARTAWWARPCRRRAGRAP